MLHTLKIEGKKAAHLKKQEIIRLQLFETYTHLAEHLSIKLSTGKTYFRFGYIYSKLDNLFTENIIHKFNNRIHFHENNENH